MSALIELPSAPAAPPRQARPLFKIGTELEALNCLLEETGGELKNQEAEGAVTAWLTEMEEDQAHKLDSYVDLIRLNEGEALAARAEAEAYATAARTRENKVKWLKEQMKLHLERTRQVKGVKTATGRTVSVQKNGGALPLEIDTVPIEQLLAADMTKTTVTADSDKIRKALLAGAELPFARLKPAGTHLRIY